MLTLVEMNVSDPTVDFYKIFDPVLSPSTPCSSAVNSLEYKNIYPPGGVITLNNASNTLSIDSTE